MRPRLSLALGALALLAATAPARAGDVRFGGYLGTSLQLGLTGCADPGDCRFLNFRNVNIVGLTFEAAPSRAVEIRADVAVRNLNFTTIETLDDTGDITKVQPVDVRVVEAKVDLFDLFGLKGFDVSAGAMRIPWGKGDGLSPSDRVNPIDLEEATGFGERLAVPAVKLSYTIASVSIEAIVIPLFVPGLLPIDELDVTALGDPQDLFDLPVAEGDEPPEVRKVETPIEAREPALDNIQVGARVRWQSPIGDLSVMFFRGFETLPQANGAARLTGFQTTNRVDLGVPLSYPRIMMVAADFRGPIVGDLSGWFDVAVLFPEEARVTAARNQLEQLVKLGRISEVPDPLPVQITQSDDVYVNAVVGLDYTVGDLFYANLQYARGMPTERQRSDIHDYVLLALRLTLVEGKLVLSAQGGMEIGDAALGYQAGGAVSWLHGDAVRLTLSTTFMGGEDGTTFQRFETLSHLRLDLRVRF